MHKITFLLIYLLVCIINCDDVKQLPMVMVVLLARNKDYALPYFFTFFEAIRYPKKRMKLFISADHCQDRTIDLIEEWLHYNEKYYAHVYKILDRNSTYHKRENEYRFRNDMAVFHVAKLKNKALRIAKKQNIDYVWFLEVDAFITNRNIVKRMIKYNKIILAPFLESTDSYANFWHSIQSSDDKYVDQFTSKITMRHETGCFEVPVLTESIFININNIGNKFLTFNPDDIEDYTVSYRDDKIALTLSALEAGVTLSICNTEHYGYVMPSLDNSDGSTTSQIEMFKELQTLMLTRLRNVTVKPYLEKYIPRNPNKTRFNIDEIYYINLNRRQDRRKRMLHMFDNFGVEARHWSAFDGHLITKELLEEKGIRLVPDYRSPFTGRPMMLNEIGCFISHYGIWNDMIARGYKTVMVLEDDIMFLQNFTKNLEGLLEEIKRNGLQWDLIYLDRNRIADEIEEEVSESEYLLKPTHTYSTTGYLISRTGALKLLEANPLANLLPVDEFLAIMYNKTLHQPHVDEVHRQLFPNRNLVAYALKRDILSQIYLMGSELYDSETSAGLTVNELPTMINDLVSQSTKEQNKLYCPSFYLTMITKTLYS